MDFDYIIRFSFFKVDVKTNWAYLTFLSLRTIRLCIVPGPGFFGIMDALGRRRIWILRLCFDVENSYASICAFLMSYMCMLYHRFILLVHCIIFSNKKQSIKTKTSHWYESQTSSLDFSWSFRILTRYFQWPADRIIFSWQTPGRTSCTCEYPFKWYHGHFVLVITRYFLDRKDVSEIVRFIALWISAHILIMNTLISSQVFLLKWM